MSSSLTSSPDNRHTWRCLECDLVGIAMSPLEAALTFQLHLSTHTTTTEQDPAL